MTVKTTPCKDGQELEPKDVFQLPRRSTERDYVRNATWPRNFFDFAERKKRQYIHDFGDDFNLIGST